MRLKKVETDHSLSRKVLMATMRLLAHVEPPDVLKMEWYRPEFFGRQFSRLEALKGKTRCK